MLPMTIKLVVVKNVCLALLIVFRMANANAIAPRIPEKNNTCWKFLLILGFLPKLRIMASGYTFAALPKATAT